MIPHSKSQARRLKAQTASKYTPHDVLGPPDEPVEIGRVEVVKADSAEMPREVWCGRDESDGEQWWDDGGCEDYTESDNCKRYTRTDLVAEIVEIAQNYPLDANGGSMSHVGSWFSRRIGAPRAKRRTYLRSSRSRSMVEFIVGFVIGALTFGCGLLTGLTIAKIKEGR